MDEECNEYASFGPVDKPGVNTGQTSRQQPKYNTDRMVIGLPLTAVPNGAKNKIKRLLTKAPGSLRRSFSVPMAANSLLKTAAVTGCMFAIEGLTKQQHGSNGQQAEVNVAVKPVALQAVVEPAP
jgi:hypothetical protein